VAAGTCLGTAVVGPAAKGVQRGCFLDLINAIACIGIAVTLFPVVNGRTKPSCLALSPLVALKPRSLSSAS
jgi:hypothetical protein